MTKCPRCQGGNLVKTVFGTFKCPQCLYEEGKFDPPMSARKDSDVNSKLRKKDSPPPTYFDAHQYLEGRRVSEELRAQKRDAREKRRVQKILEREMRRAQKRSGVQCTAQDISDPPRYFTQNGATEDITRIADIISSPITGKAARLALVRALGKWGDPRALDILTPLIYHQDKDIRRYACDAIKSIQVRHGV